MDTLKYIYSVLDNFRENVESMKECEVSADSAADSSADSVADSKGGVHLYSYYWDNSYTKRTKSGTESAESADSESADSSHS